MCFSANASFAAAGVIGAIGAATLLQRPAPREFAFAAIPIFFAAHQGIEGVVWLQIAAGEVSPALKAAWLFIAQIFWPIFTPLALLVMEDGPRRRQGLTALLAAGCVVSAAMARILLTQDYAVSVVHGNLRYATDLRIEVELVGLYVLTTVAPFLISGERFVMAQGATILCAAVVSELLFAHAAQSVWCFFAALASAFALAHIADATRTRRVSAPAVKI